MHMSYVLRITRKGPRSLSRPLETPVRMVGNKDWKLEFVAQPGVQKGKTNASSLILASSAQMSPSHEQQQFQTRS